GTLASWPDQRGWARADLEPVPWAAALRCAVRLQRVGGAGPSVGSGAGSSAGGGAGLSAGGGAGLSAGGGGGASASGGAASASRCLAGGQSWRRPVLEHVEVHTACAGRQGNT